MSSRWRRFLEALPGPNSWTLVIWMTLLQSANCKTFLRQCLANSINLSASSEGCTLTRRHWRGRRWWRRTSRRNSKRKDQGRGELVASTPLAEATRWQWFALAYLKLFISIDLYLLFKSILLNLISHEPRLSKFRVLDCLLVGRFRLFGRTNKISGKIAALSLVAFTAYRLIVHIRLPKFKFYAYEFLMSSHEDVLANELRAAKRARSSPSSFEGLAAPKVEFGKSFVFDRARDARQVGTRLEASAETPDADRFKRVNSIFYLRCSGIDSQADRWIMRPNRTAESWRALSLCAKVLLYASICIVVAWLAIMTFALAGSLLTNLGFEMSYSACVSWLRDSQATDANYFSYIYVAPKVIAHEIPIDDIPARIPLDTQDLQAASIYNVARILVDIIENLNLYLEFILGFVSIFYIVMLHSVDIVINAAEIEARLVSLVARLDEMNWLAHLRDERIRSYAKIIEASPLARARSPRLEEESQSVYIGQRVTFQPGYHSSWLQNVRHALEPSLLTSPADDQQTRLVEEISDLQAILADHFDTITRGPNRFSTFAAYTVSFIWLSYTILICFWIGATRSRALEFEFLCVELGGTLLALALLAVPAVVRSKNSQLYPLITRAMALDPNWSQTKPRWLTIVSYYYPKPLYCVTLIGSTEISWLFCLKLISWILSAFVVLASLHYSHRLGDDPI